MKTRESSRISDIIAEFKVLAEREAELAKAEIKPSAIRAALGGGMFGGAAIFGLQALLLFLIAMSLLVGWLYSQSGGLDVWPAMVLGFVTIMVLCLVIAGILALIGRAQLKRIRKPEATITEFKTTIATLTSAVKKKDSRTSSALDQLPSAEALPRRSA